MVNKKGKRNFYLKNRVYLVFIAVVVLLIGAMVLNKVQSENTPSIARTTPILKTASQSDTSPSLTGSSNVDMANWKTFKSQDVTFKYPSDWLTDPKVKRVYTPDNTGFILWIYDANDPFEKGKCSEIVETINKNNLTIIKYKNIIPKKSSDPCWGAGMENTRNIQVAKMGSLENPSINFQYSSEQEFEAKGIFDQILSTLSFTEDPSLNWKTYVNEKYGYSFKHPTPDDGMLKYDKYTDDLIEINGLDSLVIRIEPVGSIGMNPNSWWNAQTIEPYTKKPSSCFSKQTIQIVKSLYEEKYEPRQLVINFHRDVLLLNNFYSDEVVCSEPPEVQILLVPIKGRIIKVTYDWAALSEQILSTFKFTQ